jgi:hypothetical protein
MNDFLFAWLVAGGIIFAVGAIGAMVCHTWQDDWSDKTARTYTRRWLIFMGIGLILPLALPAFLAWRISLAARYAFPRESEE